MNLVYKWAPMVLGAVLSSVLLTAKAAPGNVDSSFGSDGAVYTSMYGNLAETYAAARDRFGRLVAVGRSLDPVLSDSMLMIVRYLPDGTLDSSFGDSRMGITLTTPPGGASAYAKFYAVAFDSKDRIVCAGDIGMDSPIGLRSLLAVARYTPDGLLDKSFAGGGLTASVVEADEYESLSSAIAIDSSDRIVVAGYSLLPGSLDGVVLRYRQDGSLDHSFANNGLLTTNGLFSGDAVSIDSAGRLVVMGVGTDPSTATPITFVGRYLDDGKLDASFGTGGITVNADIDATALLLDHDDGVILSAFYNADSTFALARLDAGGILDPGFGSDGTGIVYTGLSAYSPRQTGLAYDSAGHILAGENGDEGMIALRFNADGTLDNGFGVDGVAAAPPDDDGAVFTGTALTIMDDGHFTMNGWTATSDLVVVQFDD